MLKVDEIFKKRKESSGFNIVIKFTVRMYLNHFSYYGPKLEAQEHDCKTLI